MENEKLEELCMQLISYAGIAKSSYIQAIYEMKNGNKKEAQILFKEGQESYKKGHEVHQKILSSDLKIEKSIEHILLMHSEDQMMACETMDILSHEFIDCYNRIKTLEKNMEEKND